MGSPDEHSDDGSGGVRPLGRLPYLACVLPILLAMYVPAIWLRLAAYGGGAEPLIPVSGSWSSPADNALWVALGGVLLGGTIAIGWLSARRAAATDASEDSVVAAVIPWIQLVAIPVLLFKRDQPEPTGIRRYAALRGALWGLALAGGAELVSTLIFGVFGYTVFVAAPFLVGLTSAWIAASEGQEHPLLLGQGALIVASAVLFGFAFEGLICLLLIYPLAMLATLFGGAVGTALARLRTRQSTVLSSAALLPLLLTAELAEPPLAKFSDAHSVNVAAPPEAVWESIVHMGTIDERPAGPFGWGLAYPVAGHIEGAGVGAIRRGVFSTGVAYERVTRWSPNRELWFDVLSDPPMMRETNPFGPVRSAHLGGYFITRTAHFTIEATANGNSKLTLETEHALSIGPTTYFIPIARWAVDENKRRVLGHFRDRAEAAVRLRQ